MTREFEDLEESLFSERLALPGPEQPDFALEARRAAGRIIEQHVKPVLHFSGGKDSLACLYLLQPWWDRITVMWLNAGDHLPETIALMDRIRAMVPRFIEVKSDQPSQVALMGFPARVVPSCNTAINQLFDPGANGILLQHFWECCCANIWAPMAAATQRLGATLVIRGQRESESPRAPIRSGHVEDGTSVLFPIETWSREQVFEYLQSQNVELPQPYEYVTSSLDCATCTAFVGERKMRYLRDKHPIIWNEVSGRLRLIADAARAELSHVDAALAVAEESRDDTHQAENVKSQNSGGLAAQNCMEEAR